jgi:hypothetical protein
LLGLIEAQLSDDHFRSDAYIKKSAKDKSADIWSMIQSSNGTQLGAFPGLAQVFTESYDPTFDTKGDTMPMEGSKLRQKHIHGVGPVGKVKFIPIGTHNYTGVFKGSDYGYMRLSSAAQPSWMQNLVPGAGIKFLRDGEDSANTVTMPSTDGQKSFNYFKYDFVNPIPNAGMF